MINLGGIGVVAFLIWCFWVAMAGSPHKTLERVCSPISVTGNLMVSLAALAWEPSMKGTKRVFDQTYYGCQYMGWRLVYERRYKEWLIEQERLGLETDGDPYGGAYYSEDEPGLESVETESEAADPENEGGEDPSNKEKSE